MSLRVGGATCGYHPLPSQLYVHQSLVPIQKTSQPSTDAFSQSVGIEGVRSGIHVIVAGADGGGTLGGASRIIWPKFVRDSLGWRSIHLFFKPVYKEGW